MRGAAIGALLALAACHSQPQPQAQPQAQPQPQRTGAEATLLRAVYRDARSTMVLVVPEAGQRKPQGDCGAPLLVDTLTGAARVLSEAEVQARLRTMQLVGAARTACPRQP